MSKTTNEHIEVCNTYISLLQDEMKQLSKSYSSQWHTTSDVPRNENSYYLVILDNGLPAIGRPIGGKWFDNVTKWMCIPE